MNKHEWLKKHPVIRFNDAVRRLGSRAYAKLFLHRMAKAGRIKRITKGIYSTSDDVFAIASNIHYPAYISFISASYLYGVTQAIPIRVYVAAAKKFKSLDTAGYQLEFVQTREVWGYHKEKHGEGEVFIADIEKLMIDAFLKPECMGNFYEIERLFSGLLKPDTEKLKEYLLRLNSQRVYRQIGYMLEKQMGIDISGWMELDRNYYTLNHFKPGKRVDRKWRLRV